jgi:hypothetical protein
LYTKYARLESAMNSIQSQETWLSQQFSSWWVIWEISYQSIKI